MELFINLLILFFIFFTVFKRFQKIAKKKEEIKVPPSPPHGPATETETITDVLKELGRRLEHVEEINTETVKPPGEPILPDEGWIEEMQPEYAEPVPDELPEISPEAEVYPQAEEPVPVIIKPPDHVKSAARKKGKRQYALQFGGPEVVRGILMSEILGPPVSMRRERMNFN